jgi:hypothetical protein
VVFIKDVGDALAEYCKSKKYYHDLSKLTKPSTFLKDLLPYEGFIEGDEVTFVLLKSGQLGLGIELNLPNHLTIAPDSLMRRQSYAARILRTLPSKLIYQLETRKEHRPDDSSVRFYIYLTTTDFVAPGTGASSELKSLQDLLGSSLQRIRDFSAGELEGEAHCIKKDDWLAMVQGLVNINFSSRLQEFDDILPGDGEVLRHGVNIGDQSFRVLVPSQWPENISSQLFRSLLFQECSFRFLVSFKKLSLQAARQKLEAKQFWLNNALGAGARRQRLQIDRLDEQLVESEQLALASLFVITKIEHLSSLRSSLEQVFQVPWVEESHGASILWLNGFPCHSDFTVLAKFGRAVSVPVGSLANFFPCGGLKQTPPKALSYPSPEGPRQSFDLRDTPGGHMAVIAGTRSGKSFLINDMLQKYMATDLAPVISIIDKRASYETLTKYHQGHVIRFLPEQMNKMPFHPFAGPHDGLHLEFLTSYIAMLANMANPNSPVPPADRVLITSAIRDAIQTVKASLKLSGHKVHGLTLTMSDIVSSMGKSESSSAATICHQLAPFYGKGAYSAYFDQEIENIDDSPDIIAYDLDGLEADPILQAAMALALLGQVMARMKKASLEGRWGILVVEELGVLGNTPGLATFVADAWKTMAKLGTVCIGVTNDVDDYLSKPAAQAAWNNSPNKLFLRMNDDQIRTLVTANEYGPAPVTGRAAKLLPCLKTKPGYGSDFLFKAEDQLWPLVHKPSPKSYWLATSKHEEILKVKEEEKKSGIKKAIDHLACLFPHGLGD